MVIAATGWARQALIALVLVLPGLAHAQQCPPAGAQPVPQPLFTLTTEMAPVVLRNSMTREQLAGLNKKSGGAHHAGLTQSATAFTVKPSLRFYPMADGKVCAQLIRLEATWKVTQLLVDVAAQYRPGTCPYREVWEHENQHVAIAKRYFGETEQALRTRLSDLAAKFPPRVLPYDAAGQAAKETSSYFLKAGEPLVGNYKAVTDRDNAAIDTPENYRRVSARCADW